MRSEAAAIRHKGSFVDLAAGVVLAALAGFCLLWLIPNHTQPATTPDDIAPGFFPTVASATVLVLAVIMVLNCLLRESATIAELPGWQVVVELAIWAIVCIGVIVALPTAGFIPTAVTLILAGGLAARHRSWWPIVLLAILFPLVVNFGAWQIFTVDLP